MRTRVMGPLVPNLKCRSVPSTPGSVSALLFGSGGWCDGQALFLFCTVLGDRFQNLASLSFVFTCLAVLFALLLSHSPWQWGKAGASELLCEDF